VRHFCLNPVAKVAEINHEFDTQGPRERGFHTSCGLVVCHDTIATDDVRLVECPACVAGIIAGCLRGVATIGSDWRLG